MPHDDVTAIVQLLNLYGLAVDAQRWELFDRIFTEDTDVDFSAAARWHDRARFKVDFAAFHDPFDTTQHVMANHLVHVAGDRANAFCDGSWRLVRKAVDGNPLWDGTGWYDDDLVRTDAGWRISRRTCRITWWTGNPAVNETIPGVRFALDTNVLRRDAEAGRLRFLDAIARTAPGDDVWT